jgi:hypothetical protein
MHLLDFGAATRDDFKLGAFYDISCIVCEQTEEAIDIFSR